MTTAQSVRRLIDFMPFWQSPRAQTTLKTLARAAKLVREEFRQNEPLVYCVAQGSLPNGGGPLVVHYLGRKRFADDFLAFYDREASDTAVQQTVVQSLGYVRFMHKRLGLTRCPSEADILLVDNVLDWAQDADRVNLAPHINAVLPVQASMDAQLQLIRSKGHRRKVQAALKRGFAWRKTQSLDDFNLFYDSMYEPFVRDRFRFGASLVPRAQMARLFLRRGFLLFVEEDGVPVSGALMYTSRQSPDSLCYWKYGLANSLALTPHVFGERNGITEAMVLQYAVNEKFKQLDFGLTRAMPRDGIFTHKKRIGCDFVKPAGTPDFRLFMNPSSRARVLTRFPLVVCTQDGLHIWTAHEGALTPAGLEEFCENLRSLSFESMRTLRVWSHGAATTRPCLQEAVDKVARETDCKIVLDCLDL